MMTFTICFLMLNVMSLLNPMKMSVSLLIISLLLMLKVYLNSGSSWLPVIVYLLFMGGVLMMFMILSALSPNERSGKLSFPSILLIVLSFLGVMSNSSVSLLNQIWVKITMSSISTILIFTFLITFYFFCFMKVMSVNSTSMRLIF